MSSGMEGCQDLLCLGLDRVPVLTRWESTSVNDPHTPTLKLLLTVHEGLRFIEVKSTGRSLPVQLSVEIR